MLQQSQEQGPGFINVNGKQFIRDGKPYYFLGTNFWYGMNLGSSGQGGDRDRLLRELDHLKKIGVKNDVAGLDFYIPEKDNLDINSVDPMLKNGYIGFVIGGQHFTKILPPEKSAEIIDKLELPIVLLGGNEDFRRGKKIKSLTKNKQIINTCGRYNLNQSASLVKQCSVLITNDTGLMHIGAAFQKPMITIWGNTVPAFGMYPYMPGNKNNYFMAEVNNLSCRPCSKLGYNNCPKKHFRCMLNQDTEIIADKVNEYIALNSQI